MEVNFELTKDDLVAFCMHHFVRSRTVRRQRTFGLFAGLVLVSIPAALGITFSQRPVLDTAVGIWPLVIAPFVFVAFFYYLLRNSMRRTILRMVDEGENRGVFGPHRLAIIPEAIVETFPGGETKRKWSIIERVDLTDAYLIVYSGAVEAFAIPRRAFSSQQEFEDFVESVQSYSGLRAVTSR